MFEDLQNYVPQKSIVTAKDMNTLGGVVRFARGVANALGYTDSTGAVSRRAPNLVETVTARLTGDGAVDGQYDWEEVDPNLDDGSYTTRPDGRTSDNSGPANDPNGGTGRTDVVVLRRGADPADGSPVWTITGATTGVIPVSLSTDGGTNGDASTAPSYTYTVTPIGGGDPITTTASPQVARPDGTATAASYGLGYYTGGTFHLLYAFEIPGSGSCPP
jgi:hypothetical protein